MKINQFIKKNNEKILFTPGPSSLTAANLIGLEPCFGRNDKKYEKIENFVMSKLKKIAGQQNIIRLQGAASLALEVGINNFVYGKILVIDSGVYSSRLKKMCKFAKDSNKNIKKIESINWEKISVIKNTIGLFLRN